MKLASTLPSVKKVNEVKMARRWLGDGSEMARSGNVEGGGMSMEKSTRSEKNGILMI